jgi:hypothetical protein
VSFNLKNNISSGGKFKTYVRVTVAKVGGVAKEDLSFSTTLYSADIVSLLKLRSNVLYRDDEGVPIGEGYLPPQVDKKTEFQIVFSGKATQDFTELTFIANLPSGVTWEGRQNVDQGILSYNPTTRQITWQVGNIGTSDNEILADFVVSIIPQSLNVGNIMPLLSATTISYKLNNEISQTSLPALDTNLAGALYDTNKGIVVE